MQTEFVSKLLAGSDLSFQLPLARRRPRAERHRLLDSHHGGVSPAL
jgi:hypothetical protein